MGAGQAGPAEVGPWLAKPEQGMMQMGELNLGEMNAEGAGSCKIGLDKKILSWEIRYEEDSYAYRPSQ